jgi:hypothetical protein
LHKSFARLRMTNQFVSNSIHLAALKQRRLEWATLSELMVGS